MICVVIAASGFVSTPASAEAEKSLLLTQGYLSLDFVIIIDLTFYH